VWQNLSGVQDYSKPVPGRFEIIFSVPSSATFARHKLAKPRHDEDRAPTPPIVNPYWEPLQNGTLFAAYPAQNAGLRCNATAYIFMALLEQSAGPITHAFASLVDTFMRRYLYSWTNVTTGTPFKRDQVAFFDILPNYTTHSRTVQWSGI
jgi:hypothetical protein